MTDDTVEVDRGALAILVSNAEVDLLNPTDPDHEQRLEDAVEKADAALD